MGESSSPKADSTKEPAPAKDVKSGSSQNAPEDVAAKDAPAAQADKKTDPLPKAGSTWAFWYRDVPSDPKGKATEPEPGEIAVMGEGSEAQPTPVAASDVAAPSHDSNKSDTESPKEAAPSSGMSMWRRTKKSRPLSLDIDALLPSSLDGIKPIKPITRASTSDQGAAAAAAVPAPVAEQATTPTRAESVKKPVAVAEIPAQTKPNLLLPSFSSTYQMKENPSILRQVTNLVVGSSHPPPNHVFRVKSAPKIRKAIAIGVHGFFPASYLRPMIGQPTGTSLRFANLAAEAIRRWADDHGSPNCDIEKVALEGEGRINERVDNLWKLMLNWVDQIRQADLIIMACHSQGVPVGVMLLQKLIDLGIVTRARIGVCAMAGVSLGPFPDLKSSILTGSAAELWEFGNPQSNNSRRFELSLKRILDYGARITFIGSIDDQLVPMESAVYSPANHPYIYRAVFIDGRVHAPDFIAHLVGFALKIRNLGVSDHGLVRELSVALAGSLYSGEGHSRLYYDAAVYDLAITHALETADTARPTPCIIPRRDPGAASLASPNPYVLPWIMRGLLEEAYVKTELSAETDELLRQFDDWRPTNKALKDVKYRLEAVRSKL
ncbi:Uncharacterized protein ESCO_004837 [Escovopsis weberi]|uniref:YMC020W-like alpha/beta hydrolase domain-containing protein n=1 Tax=Escovopsis weberi TaxID=150374 RepID=A0A0M9VRW3_ESCWE|nr:Uncharacterized protein ESCO_004837 [Escovopsis weberi]